MASSDWTNPNISSPKWIKVWQNDYYEIEIQTAYAQNSETNKTLLIILCVRLNDKNINDGHGMYRMDTTAGIRKTSISTGVNDTPDIVTDTLSVSIGAGSSASTGTFNKGTEYIWDFTDLWYEFTHNSDGSVTNLNPIQFEWYPNTPVNSDTGVPQIDWTNVSATTLEIPAIDKSDTKGTLTAGTIGKTSIEFTYTTNIFVNYIRYKVNSGSWITIHTSGDTKSKTYTITDLNPDTSYNIKVQSRSTENVWSDIETLTVATEPLDKPKINKITAKDITSNSVKLNWSNASIDNTGTLERYELTMDGGMTYTDIDMNTSYTVTGLMPETNYTDVIGVRVIDSYGQISDTIYANFTTIAEKPVIIPVGILMCTAVDKTSISFYYTTNISVDYIRYRVNNGEWIDIHTSGDVMSKKETISGLTPNAAYTIEVQSRKNGEWSEIESFTRTTDASDKPTTIEVKFNTKYKYLAERDEIIQNANNIANNTNRIETLESNVTSNTAKIANLQSSLSNNSNAVSNLQANPVIYYGTANPTTTAPSWKKDGDIYIQYE